MRKATLSAHLTLVSLGALALSAYAYQPLVAALPIAETLLLVAALCFGAAVWMNPQALPLPQRDYKAVYRTRTRWPMLIVGVVCLFVVAEYNGYLLELFTFGIHYHVQMALFVGGVVLVTVGLSGVSRDDVLNFRRFLYGHRLEILLLVGVVLAAFSLRMWQIEHGVRALMDEGPFIQSIVSFWIDPQRRMLEPINGIATFPRVFPYIQLVFSEIFGSSITVFRCVSALFGSLTLIPLYALARHLFDRWTALMAVVLLATFPPHIHMSRIGINNIADPLFGVSALVFLILALQTRKRLYFVMAGTMLGLLAYFYEGGELLYPALVICWLFWLWITRPVTPSFIGLLWLLVTMVLVLFPVYYANIGFDVPFLSRLSAANLGNQNDFWRDFLVFGNFDTFVNFLAEGVMPPLLLPFMVPFFFLEIFHAVWRMRFGGMLLLLWVALTVLGNSLIDTNAWTARFVVVMPALVLLCAAGMRYTVTMVRPALLPVGQRWAVALLLLLTLVFSFWQVRLRSICLTTTPSFTACVPITM